MFGFSFTELVVVVLVALVVMGPKDLPKMLRKLGQWAGKLRRMASDLRAQSGIDDALRAEGLSDDIAEIRKLARGELDSVQRAVKDDSPARSGATRNDAPASAYLGDFFVAREREYPRDGADAFGALPDDAIVYAEGLPKSALGKDPLYMTGDPNGEIPPDPPKPNFGDDAATNASGSPSATADAANAAEPASASGAEGDAEPPRSEAH